MQEATAVAVATAPRALPGFSPPVPEVASSPTSASAQTILVYAWNELAGGGWLVPTLSEGTAKLAGLRDAILLQP
jgi:hypothetical protein